MSKELAFEARFLRHGLAASRWPASHRAFWPTSFLIILETLEVRAMRRISKVKVLPDYHLELEFDDGVSGTVDLSEAVGKGVFAVWRDPLVFEQVRIGSSGELVWGEQVDLCPDALYLKVTGKKPEDIFPALRNQSTHA
jgi:hypothetical protein